MLKKIIIFSLLVFLLNSCNFDSNNNIGKGANEQKSINLLDTEEDLPENITTIID